MSTIPSLALIPSGYKASKVYSVLPTDGTGDFDFTRSGNATRVNSEGLIETVGSNVPRLNYPLIDGVVSGCPSLLLEPTRSNELTYSNSSNFLLTRCTRGVQSNKLGIVNGYEYSNATSNPNININYSETTLGYKTFSLFIDTTNSDYFNIRLATGGGADFGAGVTFTPSTKSFSSISQNSTYVRNSSVGYEYFGDNIYRIWITTEYILYSGTTFAIVYFGDNTNVWMGGFQIEQGSYPTSYIQTGASTVTRTADSNEISSGLENIIGQTEGTLFLDFEYLYETTSSGSTDALRDNFVLGTDSDISEGISIDNFRSQFRIYVQGSGMTIQSIGSSSIGSAQPNTRYKLAVKYKTGDCKAYLNGSLLGSSTGTVNFVTDLNGIFFSYNSSGRPFKNQKKVYQLMIFKEALSDSELQTLTTL